MVLLVTIHPSTTFILFLLNQFVLIESGKHTYSLHLYLKSCFLQVIGVRGKTQKHNPKLMTDFKIKLFGMD